ncbi:hypothetical protein [Pseudolabrys taiwanensis]|uniref:hypothetical protein n=1 Tax=Pseudolabrys taiwanensis TaxID=331696 RepID=UPI001FDF62E1|nr:hypothetical protein [Pseudolabrys taiwanensis]
MAHHLNMLRRTGSDAVGSEAVKRRNRLSHANLREPDRALGRPAQLILDLTVDDRLDPKVKNDQWCAREQNTDNDRSYSPARKHALQLHHPALEPSPPPGAGVVSHAAVKAQLIQGPAVCVYLSRGNFERWDG